MYFLHDSGKKVEGPAQTQDKAVDEVDAHAAMRKLTGVRSLPGVRMLAWASSFAPGVRGANYPHGTVSKSLR